MTDKEFLQRIEMAYKAYPHPSPDIEKFIVWLYKQYGLEIPRQNKKSVV
jgi:hypothetical protein